MIILPKIRGFICTTAHPIGCAKMVEQQINTVQAQGPFRGPKNVLIIGASTGYGLASRIATAFGAGSKTIGVFFERPAEGNRTATAGWYNTAAFEKFAQYNNVYAKSINGDAFSNETKKKTIDLVRADLGQLDLIIYSLASPRRTHPETGLVYSSVLKPIGQPYTSKSIDPFRKEIKEITLPPATEQEIQDTVSVMGGEDWERWLGLLNEENLLANGAITIAYDYIGPELTHPIYKNGTIGKAKEHLQETAGRLNEKLKTKDVRALLSVNKAIVTQASAAIPVVPLYISLLYKAMKEKGTHEGCIEQMGRLFKQKIYGERPAELDPEGRIRMDDLEMQADVQAKIMAVWPLVNADNLSTLTDIDGYCNDFYHLFGFDISSVDYNQDVAAEVDVPSIHLRENMAN